MTTQKLIIVIAVVALILAAATNWQALKRATRYRLRRHRSVPKRLEHPNGCSPTPESRFSGVRLIALRHFEN